ncbi:MAG: diaminopimelate decarboxylase [Erysipelotrichaceae bacterium]|nr:diaminopimelate decarboxylase [Erysipelotrichaceae bacterium]
MLTANLQINQLNHLTINGHDTLDLAKVYQTPLYILDEQQIRENCRLYRQTMTACFGPDALPLYASKASCFKQLYRIINEEGLGIDVVSDGEIQTARQAGFPLEKAYFHSNNKTDADICSAIRCKVGYFVADSREEIDAIQQYAQQNNTRQQILLRLTPGIDPHTFEAVTTGKVDSKFGSAIETGQAESLTGYALQQPNIRLMGFHCHIGSQIFDPQPYCDTVMIMTAFMANVKAKFQYETLELNLGGGFGVRYSEADQPCRITEMIRLIAAKLDEQLKFYQLKRPAIRLEPGRSIIADAGLTLYTVGSVKQLPGYKNYISIDGGMTDNPRYALYRSHYTIYNAGKMREPNSITADLVGRCCESGDIIQPAVNFPSTKRGDIIAVLTTGAYNYSMASNYNRLGRPPIVLVTKDQHYLAVKRETADDVCANDL